MPPLPLSVKPPATSAQRLTATPTSTTAYVQLAPVDTDRLGRQRGAGLIRATGVVAKISFAHSGNRVLTIDAGGVPS